MSYQKKPNRNTELPSITSSPTPLRESTEIKTIHLLSPLEQNEKFKAENIQLKEENKLLNEKFNKLKSNIVALKQNLETSIYNQLEEKSTQIIYLIAKIQEASQTIRSLKDDAEGLTSVSGQHKKLRLKLFGLINQKMKHETYYLKQEEIVKSLEEKFKALREEKKKKEEAASFIEEKYYKMYGTVEENKEIIAKLKAELASKTKDVKSRIDVLNSKEMQITSLKSNLQYLKSEVEQKSQNQIKLKSKLKKVSDDNKQINSFFQDNTNMSGMIKRSNESIQIPDNEQSMKQDDENMKELKGIVKIILDE